MDDMNATMSTTRRAFLLGSAAAIAVPMMPQVAVSSAVAPKQLLAFAVGTPGEFDWQAVFAENAEQAFKQYAWSHWGGEEATFDDDCVRRVAAWDDRETIAPADWLDAGLGHHCERCDCETCAEDGAHNVHGEVVCEDCLTLADRTIVDPDRAVEDLADDIACDGEDSVKALLESSGEWELVAGDLWDRACAAAKVGA